MAFGRTAVVNFFSTPSAKCTSKSSSRCKYQHGPRSVWPAELSSPSAMRLRSALLKSVYRPPPRIAGFYNPNSRHQSDRRRVFKKHQFELRTSISSDRMILQRYLKLPAVRVKGCSGVEDKAVVLYHRSLPEPCTTLHDFVLRSEHPSQDIFDLNASLLSRLTETTLVKTLLLCSEHKRWPLQQYHQYCSSVAYSTTSDATLNPKVIFSLYNPIRFNAVRSCVSALLRVLAEPHRNLLRLTPYERHALWIYCSDAPESPEQQQLRTLLEEHIREYDSRFDYPFSEPQLRLLLAKSFVTMQLSSLKASHTVPSPTTLLHRVAAAYITNNASNNSRDALLLFSLCLGTGCPNSFLTDMAGCIQERLNNDYQTWTSQTKLQQMPISQKKTMLPMFLSPSFPLTLHTRNTSPILSLAECIYFLAGMEQRRLWYPSLANTVLTLLSKQDDTLALPVDVDVSLLQMALLASRLPQLHLPFLTHALRRLACSSVVRFSDALPNSGLLSLQAGLMRRLTADKSQAFIEEQEKPVATMTQARS